MMEWSLLQRVEEDESADLFIYFKSHLKPTRLSGYSGIWMCGSLLLCLCEQVGGTLPHFKPLLL